MKHGSLADTGLSAEDQAFLSQYHFDAPSFARLREALRAGHFPVEHNQVEGEIKPMPAQQLQQWPSPQTAEASRLIALGQAAIERGEVGVAILNGGMATRFGGVVKGVVEVCQQHSFLGLKLKDIVRCGHRVPVFLLNSFATEKSTAAHLKEHQLFGLAGSQLHMLTQSVSVRLTESGDIFLGADGRPSFFAPGHGDLLFALAAHPALATFSQNGGKYLAVSNVDNLAATLSPLVIGAHIAAQKKVTVEVAPRQAGDTGGAPVLLNGRACVLEGFRFPKTFDASTLSVFNTNTFVFSLDAVRGDWPLTWFRADKKVEGHAVVQFERLVGEITSFVEAHYLQVARSGDATRFLPVKAPQDLAGIVPWVTKHLLSPATPAPQARRPTHVGMKKGR